MVFSSKDVSKPGLQISIEGHSIYGANHTNFFGVIIDSKSNWKNIFATSLEKLLEELVLLQMLESCLIKKH